MSRNRWKGVGLDRELVIRKTTESLFKWSQMAMETCHKWGSPGISFGPDIISVKDIDNGMNNFLLQFVDDIKVLGRVQTHDGVEAFQNDLCNIEQWSNKWLMPLQVKKCRVMHFGKFNLEVGNTLSNHTCFQTSWNPRINVFRHIKRQTVCWELSTGQFRIKTLHCWSNYINRW